MGLSRNELAALGVAVVLGLLGAASTVSNAAFQLNPLGALFFGLGIVAAIVFLVLIRRHKDTPAEAGAEEIRSAWQEVEDRFQALADKGISLEWIKTADGEDHWHVACGSRQDLRPALETACKLAASTLTRFPRVRAALEPDVLSEPNPEYQWYRYLKQYGEFHDAAAAIYGGPPTQATIADLPKVSARKCVECKAWELTR